MPEKCRTLQTRHGMGAPSEDHTTPPSSRTPSSRGFSRTPAPQRSRRRRRAAIQRRRDGQARGAAWAARLLSPAWRSGGAAQGAARRPLGPLLRPTAGQTRAGTSLSTILPGAIARSLALRSPARLTERSSDLKPDLHQRGSRTVPSALPRCLPAAVYPPLNGPCPFSVQRARFARFRGNNCGARSAHVEPVPLGAAAWAGRDTGFPDERSSRSPAQPLCNRSLH